MKSNVQEEEEEGESGERGQSDVEDQPNQPDQIDQISYQPNVKLDKQQVLKMIQLDLAPVDKNL